jgi:hypothetical protein
MPPPRPILPPRSSEVPKVPVRNGVTVTVLGSAIDRASPFDWAEGAAMPRAVKITINLVQI